MGTSNRLAGLDSDDRRYAFGPAAGGMLPPGCVLVARDGSSGQTGGWHDLVRLRPVHSLYDGALCSADVLLNTGQGTPQLADAPETTGWLLYAACVQGSLHRRMLPMSVQLPRGVWLDAALVDQAEAALDRSGAAPGLLTVGLGEHVLQDSGADSLLALAALRDCGIGVAIGVSEAASGLRTLCRLPVTCLRLQSRLVQDVPNSRSARDAVERAVGIAHALNANVIGLGVDTALQRDILADLGVDAASGPAFGPAMHAHAFRQSLSPPLDA